MLQQNSKIPDILHEFFKSFVAEGMNAILTGYASNVDAENKTFDFVPIDDQDIAIACKMQAQSGFVLVPSDNAFVVVAKSEHLGYFCLFADQLDDLVIDGEIEFNGGENGGLVIGGSLTTKLNNLENKVNDLILFINTHIHTCAAPGSPTTTPVPPYSGGSLTPTTESEIVNEQVKH